MQKITNDLRFTAGSLLELLVLKALSRRTFSVDELFGLLKDAGFRTPKGSIYPLMSRLQRLGLVMSGLEESDNGHLMKTYDLTDKGRARLTGLRGDWHRLNSLIATLGR